MSRAPYDPEFAEPFASAASGFDPSHVAPAQHAAHVDPFGPAAAFPTAHANYDAQPAPVFASPSIVPSADFNAASYDLDDHELSTGRKKPTWLIAGSALAMVVGLSLVGTHFAAESRAEEKRIAEMEQIRQRMAEIDAQHKADEAARPAEPAQAQGSSVAALLAAGARANGVSQADAERPRGTTDARQAAAIRRALTQDTYAPTRKGARAPGRNQNRAADESADDGLHEERSNDPIYGL